jgi:three-Cys-motif partner protein
MSEFAIVGPWAKEKLDALSRYLEFYTKVLKNQTWATTIYLDAFAGGGRAAIRNRAAQDAGQSSLLDNEIDADQLELIKGSPAIALDVANPFTHYVFVDPSPERAAELMALRANYENRRDVDVLQTDAAAAINSVVAKYPSRNIRGVAFLDPFGAKLEWASVEKLAQTGTFEVVINFALSMAIQRMLPNSGDVSSVNRQILDAYFGTTAWIDEVYRKRDGGLFEVDGLEKRPDYHERLLELYRSRLKSAFGNVSVPRLICNTRNVPLYYLLWAGPHQKGREGADYILKMGEKIKSPTSKRRRSTIS